MTRPQQTEDVRCFEIGGGLSTVVNMDEEEEDEWLEGPGVSLDNWI